MISISLICVGRLKDAFFEEAAREYIKRLKPYARLNIIEIKACELPGEPNEAQISAALEKEACEIIKKIPPTAKTVSLCIEGRLFSSEETACLLKDAAMSGRPELCFIIGGSHGLSDKIKKQSEVKMSMSRMTFPHRLARIMLLEQLYRGFKINSGEKYHK